MIDRYGMSVGDADTYRLELLGAYYNPSSHAFFESAGIASGDTVIDVGCGHGAATGWLAERVGPNGVVFAIDASSAQFIGARRWSPRSALATLLPTASRFARSRARAIRGVDHTATAHGGAPSVQAFPRG